jgi:2-iminobutanoate/2-iminopropanoate deaminase
MDDMEKTATTVTASPRLDSVYAPEAPRGRGPFPQAVRCGDMLFVSGTGPLDPARNEPDVGSFEHEVELTMRNLAKIAEAAGCSLADTVKLTIYLADLANVPEFNAIYRRYFRTHLPARTLVQVGLRGIQVEIDGIFACPSRLPDTDGTEGDAAEATR